MPSLDSSTRRPVSARPVRRSPCTVAPSPAARSSVTTDRSLKLITTTQLVGPVDPPVTEQAVGQVQELEVTERKGRHPMAELDQPPVEMEDR